MAAVPSARKSLLRKKKRKERTADLPTICTRLVQQEQVVFLTATLTCDADDIIFSCVALAPSPVSAASSSGSADSRRRASLASHCASTSTTVESVITMGCSTMWVNATYRCAVCSVRCTCRGRQIERF